MRALSGPSSPRRLPAAAPGAKSGQGGHPQVRSVSTVMGARLSPVGPRRHRPSMTTMLWYRKRYRPDMAMNLRLPEGLSDALRALAEQTGRSQQDLAREALTEYVRDYPLRAYPSDVRHLITAAPAGSWADVVLLDPPLPAGTDVQGLLAQQRDERC